MDSASRVRLAAAVAIVACTTFAYAPVRHFEFVNFDDPPYVSDNPQVRRGLDPASIAWAFTGPHAKLWHPLTTLSHLLDVTWFDLAPGGHHVTSVVLHMLAALACLWALSRLTGEAVPSALVAILFALHPLRVESVAWIAERKDVLSGVFAFATLLAYAHFVRRPSRQRFGLLCGAFAAGLMSKSTLVPLPVVCLALDYWPLGRFRDAGSRRARLRALVHEKVPLFALAVLASLLTFSAQLRGGAVATLEDVPLDWRLANAIVSCARYVGLTFWPADLAVFYPYRPIGVAEVVMAALVLVATTGLVIRTRERWPWLLVGWLWYLVMLAPVVGVVQAGDQAYADRFTYLPQVGLLIAVVWSVRAVAIIPWGRRMMAALAGIAVIACLARTAAQVRVWQDSETLFAHALGVTGDNWLAHLNLGAAVMAKGRSEEARRHYAEAVRLLPTSAVARANLANALARAGRDAEARAHYEAALARRPDHAASLNGLGTLLARANEVVEAHARFARAVEVDPDFADARSNLADALVRLGRASQAVPHYERVLAAHPEWAAVHFRYALALAQLGNDKDAVAHYREAVRLAPDDPVGHYNLANGLLRTGALEEALGHYETAVRLAPQWWAAYHNLATALAALGRSDDAIARWYTALRADPAMTEARQGLAVVLARRGDSAGAARELREAVERQPDVLAARRALAWLLATTPDERVRDAAEASRVVAPLRAHTDQPAALDTVAAVDAASGRYADAAATARLARDRARALGEQDLAAAIADRLAAYEAGRPWRMRVPGEGLDL